VGELELVVVHDAQDGRRRVAAIVVGEQVFTVGGDQVLASSDGARFEPRAAPGEELHDIVASGRTLWTCGARGLLARSDDNAASWQRVTTGTDRTLRALAIDHDGVPVVVGDGGYAARVSADRVEQIDLGTAERLDAVYAVRGELVALATDGELRRLRGGVTTRVATGATDAIAALVVTRWGTWIVVGRGGFVARSPDGAWFTRAKSDATADLEDVAALADGRIVAVGAHGTALVSSDDGRTWRVLATGSIAGLRAIARHYDGALIGGDGGLVLRVGPPAVSAAPALLDELFANGPDGFIARAGRAWCERAPAGGDDEPRAAAEFRAIYGVPLPAEAGALYAALHRRDRARCFRDLAIAPSPRAGDGNVFDQIVRRSQTAAGELAAAFAGVFAIATTRGDDPIDLEVYAWDGPRQVLRFDRAARAFAGVVADSLDSFVYAAALRDAEADGAISEAAALAGRTALRGRVARDGAPLEPKRRDSEFFVQRARWICALLRDDVPVADVAAMFDRDLNQVVPVDQLEARLDACARFIPAALYAMWRAFLFDEPELPRYLDVARRHDARLVRDAAATIDELRADRNTLGAIADVRGRLAEFRALDLDPRRPTGFAAELERTPRERWDELAWRTLDDAGAHRALIARLGDDPQLAALRARRDDVASELEPVVEAILVGAIVRGDDLDGALDAPDDDDDDDRDESPGWAAIDRALAPLYGGAEPHAHFGTIVPYAFGGDDPIHGISVYLRDAPVPHFHFITYGFTDLFAKETADSSQSGYGFELTLRIARAAGEREVPAWALNFLQNLGRYVFGTGNGFAAGHKMGLNGPIALGRDTAITAVVFAEDPELDAIDSPFGAARFVQVVGVTDDEYRLVQEWSTSGLLDILRARVPLLVTDLDRASVLADAGIARDVERRVAVDGSSEDLAFGGDMTIDVDAARVRVELGALYAAAIPRAMRGRIRHDRPYELHGSSGVLAFAPANAFGVERDDERVTIQIPHALADEIEAVLRDGRAGEHHFATFPALEIAIAPSFIRDDSGRATDVRGVADDGERARLIAAENARVDATSEPDDAVGDADGADVAPPRDPERVRAALALSARALALAAADRDVQFTHAMLLLDADRAGVPGSPIDELLARLADFAPAVRLDIAARTGKAAHARFGEIVDLAIGPEPPATIIATRIDARVAAYGDVASRVYSELAVAVLAHAPERMAKLVPILPADVDVLAALAWQAVDAGQRDHAFAIYERLLALEMPDDGDARVNYLRALNNACVQAHAAKAYDAAVRIADRAQPVAHENPHIYHSAACAYAAVGDYPRAFEQVKLAVAHDYEHLAKVEVDSDLGPLLAWPEFAELFRAWHERRENN
jgi:photosystem II stability/assembly factor-like uncharacterized protein